VTNRQLFFILFMIMVSSSVVELPRTMAQTAGTGAWLPLMLTALFFAFPAAAFAILGNAFKGKTLPEYSVQLVGKLGVKCIAIIYMVYFIFVTAVVVRSTSEFIKNDFLIRTPIWAIALLMVSITIYSTTKGVFNLARITEFFGTITFMLAFFIQGSTAYQGDKYNILPLFHPSMVGDYFSAIPLLVFPFLGFEVLSVIPFSQKNGRRAPFYCGLNIILVGFFYTMVVYTCFMILGVEDAKNYQNALIVAIRRVDLDFLQFFKRLDVLFMISWMHGIFCSITFLKYSATVYTKQLFPKIERIWVLVSVNIIVFMLALVPKSYQELTDVYEKILMCMSILPAIVIPLLLLLIAKVKKYV
jgi:spore germination protein